MSVKRLKVTVEVGIKSIEDMPMAICISPERQGEEACKCCDKVIYEKVPFLTHDEYHKLENRFCAICGRRLEGW